MTKPTLPESSAPEISAAVELPAEGAGAAPVAATAATAAKESELVAFLRSELKLAQADLVGAQADAKKASEALATQSELYATFESVVRTSVDHMAVALGGPANGSAFAGSALADEHKRLAAVYAEKFKVGGVAATAPVESGEPKGSAAASPLFAVLARSVPASK